MEKLTSVELYPDGRIVAHMRREKQLTILTPEIQKENRHTLDYFWSLGFTRVIPEGSGFGRGEINGEWKMIDFWNNQIFEKCKNPFEDDQFIIGNITTVEEYANVPVIRKK